MFVKDVKGKWYKAEEKVLKENEVTAEEALEAIAAERAEKRKKIVDFISKFDQYEIDILKDLLFRRDSGTDTSRATQQVSYDCFDCWHPWDYIPYRRFGRRPWIGSDCEPDCQPDCQPDCEPDCQPDCDPDTPIYRQPYIRQFRVAPMYFRYIPRSGRRYRP